MSKLPTYSGYLRVSLPVVSSDSPSPCLTLRSIYSWKASIEERQNAHRFQKTVADSGGGVDINSAGQVRQSAIVARNDVDVRLADAVEVIADE